MMVLDTQCNGHAPTYKISSIYLENQKCFGRDKRHPLFNLAVKGEGKFEVVARTTVNSHA